MRKWEAAASGKSQRTCQTRPHAHTLKGDRKHTEEMGGGTKKG